MEAAFALTGVTVWRATPSGRLTLLDALDWTARAGERWAVVGANGAGKTTLLRLLGGVAHPSAGTVEILGRRAGATDMAALRLEIGLVDPALARQLAQTLTATEIVLTGAQGTILLFPEQVADGDRDRAAGLLGRLGCAPLADRAFGLLSQGERKRVLIARALMRRPRLLVLDEPTAGLDLPGREALLAGVDELARSHPELTTVQVSHHLEELPSSTTHALLLRHGRVVACGPVAEALSDETLSACFGLPVRLHRLGERYAAVAAAPAAAAVLD